MKKTILIAEDDKAISEAIKLQLESEGYKSISTDSIKKILPMISKYHPGLVILDILLADGNSIKIAKLIKRKKTKTPIIMVTARTNSGQYVKKGIVDDYLEKPFDMQDLINSVNKWFNQPLAYNQNL